MAQYQGYAGHMSADLARRVREARKRAGLTQKELARLSGVSLSWIRALEQGAYTDTRLETARKIAAAVGVPTTALIKDHAEEPADAATAAQWEPVSAAILNPLSVPEEPAQPPTVEGVRDALTAATPLFSDDAFSELRAILPHLLRDADRLAELEPAGQSVHARLLQLTGWLLTQSREFDAAEVALSRAFDAAPDALHAATTVSTQCWLLLRRGRLADARELAIRWADDVEPRMSRATTDELSAWGWLLLRVSAASIRDGRDDEAKAALRLAKSAAVAMGKEAVPSQDFLRAFGPVTVDLKRAENAMVSDHPDEVLRIACSNPAERLSSTSNNRNRHLLDVADAHSQMREYSEAIDTLTRIRVASPQWLPNQRYARDILGRIVEKRRTLTPEMRELAMAVRLPL